MAISSVCTVIALVCFCKCNVLGDESAYITSNCNISPPNSGLPCVQYTVDRSQCDGNEDKLRELFPHLYSVNDVSRMSWPGPIHRETFMQLATNITWRGPQDGNINFLKGYQVIQMGSSYTTFNSYVCIVIDLSNVTIEDFKTLKDTTFTIFNNASGSYVVTVKPLPFPAENKQPQHLLSVAPNPAMDVYHPDMNVSVDYLQLNSSFVNISVHVAPVPADLETITVLVFSSDGRLVNEQRIRATEEHFSVGDLKEGKYRLQLIPDDDSSFGTLGPCICYKGTSAVKQCVPCRRYVKNIEILEKVVNKTKSENESDVDAHNGTTVFDVSSSSFSPTATVVVPLVVLVLGVVAVSILCYHKRQGGRPRLKWCGLATKESMKLDDLENAFHQINVVLVYASDHKAHMSTVKSLADMLRNVIGCRISDATPHDATGEGSLSSADSVSGDDEKIPLTDADLFCFVNSEWAYKLVSASKSGEVHRSYMENRDDKNFLDIFHELCHNSRYQAKTVSLKFEYTSDCHVIKDVFLGPLFSMPTNIKAFLKHLHNRLHIPTPPDEPVEICSDQLVGLVSAINATFAYQNKNKLWISTKLFYLRNAPSSDDSGVVITRRKKSRTKSIRSRSAETVTCHAYSCHSKTSRQICPTCELKYSTRLRANSCNLSFYPPDSECDDVSIGYSLIESRLVDINKRYTHILNKKMKTEEDCLTLDGQSV